MDFLHRTPMPDDLRDRVKLFTSKRSTNESSGLEDISLYLHKRLENLRDNTDQKFVSIEYSILLGPLALGLIWALIYTDQKLFVGIIFLLTLSYLLFANYRMKDLILQNQGLKWKDEFKENASLFIQSKILYLKSALDIKLTRISLLRNFYLLFFPVLLCTLYFLIFSTHAFNNIYIALVAATLVGSTFWFWYYNKEIEELKEELQLASDMENSILVTPEHTPSSSRFEEE